MLCRFANAVSFCVENVVTVLFANELPDVIFVSLHPGTSLFLFFGERFMILTTPSTSQNRSGAEQYGPELHAKPVLTLRVFLRYQIFHDKLIAKLRKDVI